MILLFDSSFYLNFSHFSEIFVSWSIRCVSCGDYHFLVLYFVLINYYSMTCVYNVCSLDSYFIKKYKKHSVHDNGCLAHQIAQLVAEINVIMIMIMIMIQAINTAKLIRPKSFFTFIMMKF